MSAKCPLGILDVAGAIEETVELAPLAEKLGYHRYWITEHQPQPTPVLTVAIVAGLTERIRVGTAGLLMHYHPPRRTAHDVLFLERVYEGRIDCGFVGGILLERRLLDDLEGRDPAEVVKAYPERIATFVDHLRNTGDREDLDRVISWGGAPHHPPEIWSHGTGTRSAEMAARHGLGFGFGLLFPGSVDSPDAVFHYRDHFVPARAGDRSRAILAVGGVVADSDATASALAVNEGFKTFVSGGPATVVAELRRLVDRYRVEEIVFADLLVGLEQRQRCYELLMAAWND